MLLVYLNNCLFTIRCQLITSGKVPNPFHPEGWVSYRLRKLEKLAGAGSIRSVGNFNDSLSALGSSFRLEFYPTLLQGFGEFVQSSEAGAELGAESLLFSRRGFSLVVRLAPLEIPLIEHPANQAQAFSADGATLTLKSQSAFTTTARSTI